MCIKRTGFTLFFSVFYGKLGTNWLSRIAQKYLKAWLTTQQRIQIYHTFHSTVGVRLNHHMDEYTFTVKYANINISMHTPNNHINCYLKWPWIIIKLLPYHFVNWHQRWIANFFLNALFVFVFLVLCVYVCSLLSQQCCAHFATYFFNVAP